MLTLELVTRDTTPPQLLNSNIPDGTNVGITFQTVILQFSKPLAESTVTPANFQLVASDDTPLTPQSILFRDDDRTVQVTFPTLEVGTYKFTLDELSITDRLGNPLGSGSVSSKFTVLQYSAVWINPLGGDWSDPLNWSSGKVPETGDDVLIDVTDSSGNFPTITYDSGTTEIHSLLSFNPLTVTGGSLQVDTTVEVDNLVIASGGVLNTTGATIDLDEATGNLTLDGGTLQGGTVNTSGGAKLVVTGLYFGGLNNNLDGVTLNGNLDLTNPNTVLFVEHGLTLNGTAAVDGILEFDGSQTLGGNGDVDLDLQSELEIDYSATLTVGSNVRIHGGVGTIDSIGSLSEIVDEGSIDEDVSGDSLIVNVPTFENEGVIGASSGSSLTVTGLAGNIGDAFLTDPDTSLSLDGANYILDSSFDAHYDGQTLDLLGTWSLKRAGVTITVDGATLGLGSAANLVGISVTDSTIEILGRITAAQIQQLLVAGNRLLIGPGGILDTTGNTLSLDASTGDLTLAGGTVKGGTVSTSGGAEIVAEPGSFSAGGSSYDNTLDGVTLDANLDLTALDAELDVVDGLTLNGVATVGAPTVYSNSMLYFAGNQVLDGTGSVDFGLGYQQISVSYDSTLTIGPDITIHGNNGEIDAEDYGATVINEGSILADESGSVLTVNAWSFQNSGAIGASGGGDLQIYGLNGSLGNVSLAGSGSAMAVVGANYAVDSSFSFTDGETLDLLGTWTLDSGTTLTVSDATLGLGNPGDSSKMWSTSGTITLADSTLDLGGSTSTLAGLSLTNSSIQVESAYTFTQIQSLLLGNNQLILGPGGVLDNTGDTIALDATTGNLRLDGGTLQGGLVTSSGGAKVVTASGSHGSTLDGVTLDAGLDLTAEGGELAITDGLTLDGTATVGDPSDSFGFTLEFIGSQTLDGTGNLVFGGGSGYDQLSVGDGSTLTIGPGITIHGSSGTIGSDDGDTVISQGTIEADVSGGFLAVNPANFENEGTIGAANGGGISVKGLTDSLGLVSLIGTGSSIFVNGTNYTVDSSLSVTDGQFLSLLGSWNAGAGATVTVTNATLGLGDTTSLNDIDLASSILNVYGTYTFVQLQPLLSGNNQLVIGPGGVIDNTDNYHRAGREHWQSDDGRWDAPGWDGHCLGWRRACRRARPRRKYVRWCHSGRRPRPHG